MKINHKIIMGLVVAAVFITGVYAMVNSIIKQNSVGTTESTLTNVNLLNVKDYKKNQGYVSSNGTVESLQQAELSSQVTSTVSDIRVSIGDKVQAGQILVTLQNDDLNAQLSQAKASLKAQQANLEQMKKGARTEELQIAQLSVDTAKQTLEDTKKQQDTLVSNAYQSLLNSTLEAVPESNYDVTATISGTYTGTTEGEYAISIYPTSSGYSFTANKGGNTWSGAVSTNPTALGNEGLYIAFSSVTRLSGNEKWTVKMPNTKAANYLAYYNAYQTALTSRQTAVNAATSALESAESALALTKAGATAEQIKSQEAVVEQAQATVENITVQLNKTIIRSPISGTVSSLSAKYGELIGGGQLVASIVNQSGLQIKSYVSDKDLPLIEKGAAVIINGSIKGEVSRLSPSVNANTKTAEVNIIVSEPENSSLIVGQNATVKIAEKTEDGETSIYELPLQAVKVTDSSAYVYQVVNSTLEEKQVTIGQVDGEFIEIKSGLDENMQIVSTVYELRNGQKVNIEE